MEKLYNEAGEVAVAVSFGFGAGWSSWTGVDPMDAKYNKLFLEGNVAEVVRLCEEAGSYGGGAEDVSLVWVKPGTEFIITEYDGAESIEFKEETPWLKA